MEWVKRLIWRLIPYDMEIRLRCTLQPGFRKKHIAIAARVSQHIAEIERKARAGRKIRIVFFCYSPSYWNACRSVFEAAMADPALEVYLLALPASLVTEDGAATRGFGDNLAYAFCQTFYPSVINAYDETERRWFDLRSLSPDYVVLSRPYDREVQPDYRSAVIASYAKICYIPYAYCKMNWDSRMVYGCDFMDSVYAVFTENEMYRAMVERIFHGIFKAGWKQVCCVGYPRLDLFRGLGEKPGTGQKTVLWLPRWTTKNLLEPSTFFRYKDALVGFARAHPGVRLICRPHQLMFQNFISTGEMTEADVAAFKKLFAETPELELDESGDYLPAFTEADIFVGDTTSLLIEAFVTGKPVIYCGSPGHFDREARKWARLMYCAGNWNQVKNRLSLLLAGNDPGKSAREEYIRSNIMRDQTSGKQVICFIKRDFKIEKGNDR